VKRQRPSANDVRKSIITYNENVGIILITLIMKSTRYLRQETFSGIGPGGQARLKKSKVLVAGCGAVGGTIATLLVRAGVGRLRVVDRDSPELSNLHRQLLYIDQDLAEGAPKALVAGQRLSRMNPEVKVEGIMADLNASNIREMIKEVDLIMDGTDNQETRYLINDAAVTSGIPWIFAGAVGAGGNVMAVLPGKTPCLRCLFPEPAPPGSTPTADTVGIIGPAPSLVASLAAAEALKILCGARDQLLPGMLIVDLWKNTYHLSALAQSRDPDCPACGKLMAG
jgi:adenylyltransferase/sulfurtransferase